MEVSKEDIFSYANGMTLTGVGMSGYGAVNIDELGGVLWFGGGRFCDFLDGYIARRTHSSEFGAKLDATADKVAVALLGYYAWVEEVIPEPAIAVVVGFNVLNAVANTYLEVKGEKPETNKFGKFQMFGFMTSLGMFGLDHNTDVEAFNVVANLSFGASLPFAYVSSKAYTQDAINAYRDHKQAKHKQTKNHQRRRR